MIGVLTGHMVVAVVVTVVRSQRIGREEVDGGAQIEIAVLMKRNMRKWLRKQAVVDRNVLMREGLLMLLMSEVTVASEIRYLFVLIWCEICRGSCVQIVQCGVAYLSLHAVDVLEGF